MALITAQEIYRNTSMGGNVDPDKFIHLIRDAEITILEPVLGTALYDKIITDFNANSLAGDYLEMFENYIKDVLWHSVYAMYLREGIILAQNTGIYENTPENRGSAQLENVQYVAKSAQSKADMYIARLERYLCDKNIPEYMDDQPNDYDVHPEDVRTIGGWHLGRDLHERPYSIGRDKGNFLELE